MSTNKTNRTPSLQHLVKHIAASPEKTASNIIQARDGGFTIRNFEARRYLRVRLKKMPLDAVLCSAERERNKHIRATALETLPLLEDYISRIGDWWFRQFSETFYQVAPGVVIPIKALGLIGYGGKTKVLCPQLWKNTTLSADQFNMWASFFDIAVLRREPDVHDFDWLEMSVPDGKKVRELRERSIESARILSDAELREVHDHLEAAMLIVTSTPRKKVDRTQTTDPNQRSFDY